MKTAILVFFTILLFIGISCESNVPKPDCETYNYGTVVVINKSPNSLYVDVTETKGGWNDTQYLPVFQQIEYHMRPGTIWLYSASPANYAKNIWVERTNSISQCKSLHFNWTSGSKNTIIEIDSEGNVNQIYDDSQGIERKNPK